jgi:hypothetical protein
MTAALTRRFGPGEWLLPGSITTPYLNLSLVQVRRFDPAAVERTAADAARAEEHIARFYTRRELLNGAVQNDQIGAAASAGSMAPGRATCSFCGSLTTYSNLPALPTAHPTSTTCMCR